MCPITAFEKWKKVSKIAKTASKPAFKLENGLLYTGKQFNKDLEKLLEKHIKYKTTIALSHSAGLSTAMAKLGCTDDEICEIGRWNSTAFFNYVKSCFNYRSIFRNW